MQCPSCVTRGRFSLPLPSLLFDEIRLPAPALAQRCFIRKHGNIEKAAVYEISLLLVETDENHSGSGRCLAGVAERRQPLKQSAPVDLAFGLFPIRRLHLQSF